MKAQYSKTSKIIRNEQGFENLVFAIIADALCAASKGDKEAWLWLFDEATGETFGEVAGISWPSMRRWLYGIQDTPAIRRVGEEYVVKSRWSKIEPPRFLTRRKE